MDLIISPRACDAVISDLIISLYSQTRLKSLGIVLFKPGSFIGSSNLAHLSSEIIHQAVPH